MTYAEFSKGGGGPGNLRMMKTKKNFSTQNQSVFLPKIRWRPKKKSSLNFSLVFGRKVGEDQKKSLQSDFVRFCAQTFCPSYKGGCRDCTCNSILILLYWRPKGGGGGVAWYHAPPKFAPETMSYYYCRELNSGSVPCWEWAWFKFHT